MSEERREPPATSGGAVSPGDIQKQEFGVSRFGGYRMRDVDEFLDRLTESTEALLAENERLRAGGAPIVGTSDLDEVNRQADEILQRAREQAARIVAEATASATPAVSDGAAERPAVDAFLHQERAFLQSLAGLVQGHAESVKAMARKTRQPTPTAPEATEPVVTEAIEATTPMTRATDPRGDEDVVTEAAAPEAEDTGDETVVIEVPQHATTPGGDRDPDAGDPSLKKLFWGDDR